MPPNDVVQHNLNVPARVNWDESEPLPIPLVRRAGAVGIPANPPVDTMITDPTIDTAPYRSVGKMHLKFDPLIGLNGSGWVVARRAFITAGHCVYYRDKGGWIYEAAFCPRFNIECAEKIFTVERVLTLQGWIDTTNEDDRQYDMAACVVTEPFLPSEPPLEFVVSSLPALDYAAIGYPGPPIPAHPFNRKRMWQSAGGLYIAQNSMVWAENDLTNGASGGPWCEPASNWVVGGLTSARLTDDPNLAVSPVLGQGFENLYNAVKNL